MISNLNSDELYDVVEIQAKYSDLILVYKIGQGDWADYLYRIPSEGLYLEKGAFGDHDAVCFRLSDVKDDSGALAWKNVTEAYWKKHYPTIKLDP